MKPSEVYLNTARRLGKTMPADGKWSAWNDFEAPASLPYPWTSEGREFIALFGLILLTKHEAIVALCFMAAIVEKGPQHGND